MLNFVALDFETANEHKNSAISLAVVTVEEGRITKRGYSLIKPPVMQFTPEFIDIHGIRPDEVVDKPTFDQLWPTIYEHHLKGKLVVAHNAKFDMDVLRATLDFYGFEWPELYYADSVKMARKMWPDLENHRLNTVGAYLGISFHHHHALEDAETCAKLVIAAGQQKEAKSLPELLHLLGVKQEEFITPEKRKASAPSNVQTSMF